MLTQPANTICLSSNNNILSRKELKPVAIDLLVFLALTTVNFLCYCRTLSGYFLADDFVHISYLAKVFAGHPELLLANFIGNWLQAQGTSFYRPFISLTLAVDYFFGGSNASIFHVTNTLYQTACSIFLFLLTRKLLEGYGNFCAALVAFFSALLFAVSPLHPEVVSWVIGRVDSVCTAFYLASFWLFLKGYENKHRLTMSLSLTAFIVSLLSKEMAVTLPLTLTIYFLINNRAESSLSKRLLAAITSTWKFWLVLAIYILIRSLALGTFSGGYLGSIGEGLSTSLFKRWFMDGSCLRVFFPFNAEVFSEHNKLRQLLGWLYLITLSSVVLRLILLRKNSGFSRLLVFSFVWFVIALAPTYQVWNLTNTLQGSRFIYLASAPLVLVLTLLVFPLSTSQDILSSKHFKVWQTSGIALLTAFSITFAVIAYKNNMPWAQASSQVKSLRAAIERELLELPSSKKLVVLQLPNSTAGAHMIYNGAMLHVLLSPPLCPQRLSHRVISFEPMTFGDSDLLINSRLSKLLLQKDSYVFCIWDMAKQQLKKLNLNLSDKEVSFNTNSISYALEQIQQVGSSLIVTSPWLNLSSCATAFVNLTLVTSLRKTPIYAPYVILSWSTVSEPFFLPERCLALPAICDGKPHIYSFPVAEHKSWVAGERIAQIRFEFPFMANSSLAWGTPSGALIKSPSPAAIFSIAKVELIGDSNSRPFFTSSAASVLEDINGVGYPLKSSLEFVFDASKLPQAKSIVVEISKPDSWFEHYSGTFHDCKLSEHCLKRFALKQIKGKFQLSLTNFPSSAYYQVRLAAQSNSGSIIGCFSDPVNLQISAKHFNLHAAK